MKESKIGLDKIFDILIIVLFILIICAGSTIIADYKEMMIILLAITAVMYNLLKYKGIRIRIRNSTILWLLIIILFIAFGLIQTINVNATVKYLLVFGCLTITIAVDIPKDVWRKLMNAIFIMSLVTAFTIILSTFIDEFMFKYFSFLLSKDQSIIATMRGELYQGIYSGLLCERAFSAVILNMGIGIIFSKMNTEPKIRIKYVIELIILFISLMLTGKRMLFLIPIAIFFFLFLINKAKGKMKKGIQISVTVFLVGLIVLNYVPQANIVLERFEEKQNDGDMYSHRPEMFWNYCINMFNEKPIVGYGFGTFPQYLTRFRSTNIYHAHNIYYQLLGETGIIGTSIFIIFFAMNLIKTLKLHKKIMKEGNHQNLVMVNFSLSVQLLFLIYGLSGNTLYYTDQLTMYMMSIGILLKLEDCVKEETLKGEKYINEKNRDNDIS